MQVASHGQSFQKRAKRADVSDQRQGYGARNDGSPNRSRDGIPLPPSYAQPARNSRLGLSTPTEGHLCPRVLLAPASQLLTRSETKDQRRVLGPQVVPKHRTGQSRFGPAAGLWLAGAGRLGVRTKRSGVGDPSLRRTQAAGGFGRLKKSTPIRDRCWPD